MMEHYFATEQEAIDFASLHRGSFIKLEGSYLVVICDGPKSEVTDESC